MIRGVGVGGVAAAAEGVAVAGVLPSMMGTGEATLVAVGMLALVVEAAMMLRAVASLEIPLPSVG